MKPNWGIQSLSKFFAACYSYSRGWAESRGVNPHPLNECYWNWDNPVAEVYQGILFERRIGLSQPAFRCPDLALAAWPWEAKSCAGREVKQGRTLRSGCLKRGKASWDFKSSCRQREKNPGFERIYLCPWEVSKGFPDSCPVKIHIIKITCSWGEDLRTESLQGRKTVGLVHLSFHRGSNMLLV